MALHAPAFSGLLPHPPIVVPEVGRAQLADCRRTWRACTEFARRLVRSAPDRVLLVSPHAPRRTGAFGLSRGRRMRGDLGRFGAPRAAIDLPHDRTLVDAIAATAAESEIATWWLPDAPLDHGAVVPLSFLCTAGWSGPTAIVSLPVDGDPATLGAFGHAVARALARLPGGTALVASGDMTHRATPDGPHGFDARGLEFDRTLQQLVRDGRLAAIADLDPALRAAACEDAADPSLVVAAATDYAARGAEVLSYEHPFGVGYLVAVFHDGGASDGD